MPNETRLTAIDDNLWGATHRVNAGGGVLFDSRMSIIRLADGGLVVYSPIPIDAELGAEIDALGEVQHIIAPNGFHYLFAEKARARFPGAMLWASRALEVKGIDVKPDHWLGDVEPAFKDELTPIMIGGSPKGQEWDLLHHASASLIVCDLVFHITAPPNAMTKFALWMAGAGGGRLAQSRLWRFMTKDKTSARESIEALLRHEFTRLVPGHGDIIEDPQLPAKLRGTLWWMLGEKPA